MAEPPGASATTPGQIRERLASAEERDIGFRDDIAQLRKDLERLEERLWRMAALGGGAAGATGALAAKLLEVLG